jgi:hypothetical protein
LELKYSIISDYVLKTRGNAWKYEIEWKRFRKGLCEVLGVVGRRSSVVGRSEQQTCSERGKTRGCIKRGKKGVKRAEQQKGPPKRVRRFNRREDVEYRKLTEERF